MDIGWFLASVVIIYLIGHFLYYDYEDAKWKRKLADIASSRPYLSKSEYIQIVNEKGYEVKDIEACYDIIDSYMPRFKNPDFSIYPEDDIFRLYRIDDDDLTDDIEDLFKKLGLSWLSNIEFNELNTKHNNIFNIYYLLDVIQVARGLQK